MDRFTSFSSTDNKERVYYSDPGGMLIDLAIVGFDVSSDDSGCGTNSQKVYFSYFYEDSDRDDLLGPPAFDIDPE